MSLLSGFLQGAADQFIVENNKKAAQEKEYMDRKRAIAERERQAAADRKARRAERLEEREWDKEDRAEADGRKVVETYVNDKGEVVERLADGTTRVARTQTQQERGDDDLNRRYKEAQIAAYNRGGGGSGGRDDEERPMSRDDAKLAARGQLGEEATDAQVDALASQLLAARMRWSDLQSMPTKESSAIDDARVVGGTLLQLFEPLRPGVK